MTQRGQIRQLLEKQQMAASNPVLTPSVYKKASALDANGDRQEDYLNANGHARYRAIVGSLLYLSHVSRPDISNTVRELSRHLQRPTKIHLQMAKRTLRYLRGTLDRALRFGKGDGRLVLDEVYSDATWNSDYTTSRSITGYMLFVNGTSVTWKS
eukprot:scaffold1503_cov250-Pinguiococcus_pyrenoidosus.AAC.24